MITLHDLQRRFAEGLDGGADDLLSEWLDAGPGAERFDIYRRNRQAALAAALESTYPAVHALVGADFFAAAAADYGRSFPPRAALLAEYGDGFPAFLRDYRSASCLPYLHDVARLEWTVACCAFTVRSPVRHALGELMLTLAPGLTLLEVDFPVAAIWRATLDRDEAALAQIDPAAAPSTLAVYRHGAGASVTELSVPAAAFVEVLLETGSIESALARTAEQAVNPVSLVAAEILHANFVNLTPNPGESQ